MNLQLAQGHRAALAFARLCALLFFILCCRLLFFLLRNRRLNTLVLVADGALDLRQQTSFVIRNLGHRVSLASQLLPANLLFNRYLTPIDPGDGLRDSF